MIFEVVLFVIVVLATVLTLVEIDRLVLVTVTKLVTVTYTVWPGGVEVVEVGLTDEVVLVVV